MMSSKCNLYLVGNPGIGKSYLRRTLEELINYERFLPMDNFKGYDWIIRTNKIQIEVEIKIYRDFEFKFHNEFLHTKNIIIYFTNGFENKTNFTIQQRTINELRSFSKKALIIIATPLPEQTKYTQKFNYSHIKSNFPFVEYFLPITRFYARRYESSYQLGSVLRQIIINSFPQSLQHVKEIIINNNQTKNTTLDLGNCGLTSLNDVKELFQNTHLTKLILSNEWGVFRNGGWDREISINRYEPNVLFCIPKEIGKLKNLETLIAGGNWRNTKRRMKYFSANWYITDVKPLTQLKKLSILNLSNNQIEATAPLYSLSNLSKLYLNNNSITNFPSIDKFQELKELYLSNNQIKNIKFLSSDQKLLETIDLHSNQITDLSPIRSLISRLDIKDSKWENETISISNNPLSIPPAEIAAKGKKNVESYFSKLEAEKEIEIKPFTNTDIKLIMAGNSNVGKSTFVEWLKTGKVNKDIETTHWLNLGIWKYSKEDKNYTVRIFDFGGQEYYHDTHHLFFTNRTAYALLWDKISNHFGDIEVEQTQHGGQKKIVKIETFTLEYWLDSIRYHTQKRKLSQVEKSVTKILNERNQQIEESIHIKTKWEKSEIISANNLIDSKTETDEENILIIQNKVDSKNEKEFLNQSELTNNYPKIYDFEQVSLYENKRLESAKNILFEIFDSLEILNRQFLGTWNHIKQDIETKKPKKSSTIDDFLKYCNKIIKRLPELKNKSTIQRKKVLFTIEDAKVFATFLSDIGLCLFYPENNDLSEKVFLNQDQILKYLNKILLYINKTNGEISEIEIAKSIHKNENSEEVKDIVNLMLHFKILFRHPAEGKNSYIAPLYLPKNPPKSISLFQSLFQNPEYRFEYKKFIHKSIILDLFHKYGSKTLTETSNDSSFFFWKNGIIIKDKESNEIVMVKFSTWNEDSKCASLSLHSLSGTIGKFIETIVDHIDTINKEIKVTKCIPNETKEEYIPLDILRHNEAKGNPVFFYNGKYFRLTSFKKYLKSPLKMKKIFISYSKQDLRLVNKFIEHLSGLQIDGKVSHWYCSELEGASNWNTEIQKHLDDSDIVCFMISSNFMKTQYIHEHEIKKAFERKQADSNFKILPIILNFCHWTTEQNNLGEFTAIPYTAKPVMDFKNQDMAWYIIESCIRIMIEKDLDPKGDDFFVKNLPPDILKIYIRIIEGKVDDNSL